MRDIVIFGCGGVGREVLQIVRSINNVTPTWNCLGFAVDPEFPHPARTHDLRVINDLGTFTTKEKPSVAIAIGDPSARQKVTIRLMEIGFKDFPRIVHPMAWIGDRVSLADGVVVYAGASLTTDISVGEHVHLNPGTTVGHDAVIGPFCTLAPGANVSGHVTLGEGVNIGTGACVINGVEIGDRSVIGAGAAVIRAIPPDSTAVGVPARVIKGPST